jgi:hypothetical protein
MDIRLTRAELQRAPTRLPLRLLPPFAGAG